MTDKAKNEPQLPSIHTIRRQKVVLDDDVARLYGVSTARFNEAVKRNRLRFPVDFRFQLTNEEVADLRSQSAILKREGRPGLKSQSAILETDRRGKHRKYLPWAFTEHGALMAANILHSDRAVEMSVYLVRAFVQMRETILANVTFLKRFAEIDRRLIEHDSVLRTIIERLQPLLNAPAGSPEKKPKIGFHRGNR